MVGMGTSRPIMITDDHKTTGNVHRSGEMLPAPFTSSDLHWCSAGAVGESPELLASPNCRPSYAKNLSQKPRMRAKPYDTVRSNTSRITSREASISSQTSPTISPSITRSSTPSQCQMSDNTLQPPNSNTVFASSPTHNQDSHVANKGTFGLLDISMIEPEWIVLLTPTRTGLNTTVLPHAMPFLFYNPSPPSSMSTLPLPKIHRLIPACGPTHGGIEVTVLGANFCPSIQLNCVFGDVTASSTQRWSDNTLVCILPPQAVPGVVAVWFEGLGKEDDNTLPSLFTYSDESDRAL